MSDELNWREAIASYSDAYAPSTMSARVKSFAAFATWAEPQGLSVLPADPETVAAFLDAMLPRCAVRTAQGRLSTIRWLHQMKGLPDPTRAECVRLAFRRGLRNGAKPPRSAGPLVASLRDRMIAACPPTLLGLRDRAMIAVGYDTLCRRNELVRLLIDDLEPQADGGARIRIRRSKADPLGRGAYGYLSAPAMAHLDAWLNVAGLREGYIFRKVQGRYVRGGPLEAGIVNRAVRLAGELAGLDEAVLWRLTAHSLRVGPVHDLARAGRTPIEIMRAGRWSSLDAMMPYVREADINVWAS